MREPRLVQTGPVPVAEVDDSKRLRPVSEAGVESLIASVAELGVMKDPVHVRRVKSGALVLIAGGHRLEAARRLGWEEIEAKVWTDVTDDWARLMEIDDNLAGAEMNALDTAVFLAERKRVYEKLHPETKHGVAGAIARWDASDIVSFASATAEKFGVSRRHIERLVAAGTKLGTDEVRQLRGAPRPVTLKDLTEISKIANPVERYDVVARLSQGSDKSAAAARKSLSQDAGTTPPPKDPVEEAFQQLLKAWSRAPMAAKRRFADELSGEIGPMLDGGVE